MPQNPSKQGKDHLGESFPLPSGCDAAAPQNSSPRGMELAPRANSDFAQDNNCCRCQRQHYQLQELTAKMTQYPDLCQNSGLLKTARTCMCLSQNCQSLRKQTPGIQCHRLWSLRAHPNMTGRWLGLSLDDTMDTQAPCGDCPYF